MAIVETDNGVIVRLEPLVIDPLYARLPHTSHVFPNAAIGLLDEAYSLPGGFRVCTLKVHVRPHDADPVFVGPSDVFTGKGPFDRVDDSLPRVQNGISA